MEKGLSEAKVCFDPCDLRELFIVLSFRISGNFPLFHLRDFGQSSAILSSRIWRQFFRHSAIPSYTHQGITQTRQFLPTRNFWPGMDDATTCVVNQPLKSH